MISLLRICFTYIKVIILLSSLFFYHITVTVRECDNDLRYNSNQRSSGAQTSSVILLEIIFGLPGRENVII